MSTNLDIFIGYGGTFNDIDFPKYPTKNAKELCVIGWSWTPYHSREDTYLLDVTDDKIILWLSYFDEDQELQNINIIGFLNNLETPHELAAEILLTAFWKYDVNESDIDCYHYCYAKWLEIEVINMITNKVWP